MASLSKKLEELRQIEKDLKPLFERYQPVEAFTTKNFDNQVKGV